MHSAKPIKMNYQLDIRDSIAANWPARLDDSAARRDWGWKPEYELDALVEGIVYNILFFNPKINTHVAPVLTMCRYVN